MSGKGQPVAKAEEIPPGTSKLVSVGGKEVAVFNVDGRFFAVGNRCPHRSGPLVRGRLECAPEGTPCAPSEPGAPSVRCPIHGWLFELSTGRCLTRAGASTPTFPVACEGGMLYLGEQQGESVGPSAPVSLPQ